jgi:HSP20 family protein
MYRSLFPGDLFAEFERLQRAAQRLVGPSTSLRGFERSGFPQINVGGTQDAIEIFAFAPGLDPAKIDVNIERGVLTIAGERMFELPTDSRQEVVHLAERFTGKFSRAISVTDDADPNQVTAKYTDGVLHITIKRAQKAQRRSIAIH